VEHYTIQFLLGEDHHYKIKDYLDTSEEKIFNDGHSLNKNRLTIRHALWATFYILITYVLYSFILGLIISTETPLSSVERIPLRLSPLFYLIVLFVLLIYVRIRPGLDLSDLGFRKAKLKNAIRYGVVMGLIAGISKLLVSKLIGDPLIVLNLQTPFLNLVGLVFHFISASSIWGIITFGPVFEEAFFRGLWYGVLREKMPKLIAAIITSFVFSVLHGVNSLYFYFLFFLIGLILALLYEKTKNLYSSISAHIMINFVTFLFLKMH